VLGQELDGVLDQRLNRHHVNAVAAMILLFFVAAGEIILTAIGTPLSAFQIAGGIVLFLFALTMIFGEGKPEEEVKMVKSGSDTAIFPLAVPSIAGPGAMLAAVLQTENDRFNLWEQAETTAIMLLVLSIVLVLMLTASKVHRFIGDSGASIISRVMGLILASVAVASVLEGIKEYFAL
jgi:multiple antibiotic resistance protein